MAQSRLHDPPFISPHSSTAPNNRDPPALTFSASLFRQISPALYLHRHISQEPPARPNGRHPEHFRDFSLTTNSLSHAHGSAVVRVGDTAVVCGVRGEILTLAPGDDAVVFESHRNPPNSTAHARGGQSSGGASWGGLIVPNVELATGCSKKYPLGAPGDFAQSLSDQLSELIKVGKPVDLESLRIVDQEEWPSGQQKVRGYWVLYADISCISLDGNILDAAWYAMIAALMTSKLPRATWSPSEERISCNRSLYHPINTRKHLPFVTTFAIIYIPSSTDTFNVDTKSKMKDTIILNDPDSFEEEEAIDFLTILSSLKPGSANDHVQLSQGVSKANIRIEKIDKKGGAMLQAEDFSRCASLAASKVEQYINVLHNMEY